MKVTVIIPTFNERDTITALLSTLDTVTKSINHHTFSYLVVDDNSPDGTIAIVKQYQRTHKNVYLLTGAKEGLGKALLRGMAYATAKLGAQILIQMDADLSHDPHSLPFFIQSLDHGADFVVGSRYIAGGSIPDNWAIHRKIFSIIGNAMVRFGLGYLPVHDWTGGYRVFRKIFFEMAKDDLVKYQGYVFQIALLHASIIRGADVVEVPIHFTDRRFGHSKIAPSQYIRDVFMYVLMQRIVQIRKNSFTKFCVVGTIGFIINTVILELSVRWGLHPSVGSIGGAELAIVSNFVLNNAWTFQSQKITGRKNLGKKFIQFNGTSLGALVIQASAVTAGTFFMGVASYRVFYGIGVAIGLVWNYTMYSRVIWKEKKVL